MPRRPTEREVYDDLLDRFGRDIADAFTAAVADLRAGADLQRVIAAIQVGDLESVIAALNLQTAAYSPVLEALRSTYLTGGQTAAAYAPGAAAAVIRFDLRNPRAERWLGDHSARLVSRTLDDQRAAVRQALIGGLSRGENPRTTALDIVGRIDRATGRRDGGILGLNQQQEKFVAAARAELTSADPALLKNYLTRARRDKRFDRSVARAIKDETALPAETAGKALRQYKNRLLQLRGEMIGRTESLTALRASKHETYLQAAESGALNEAAVRRVWDSVGDLRVRHTHRALDGDSVGLREPFLSPSGARLMYPGDTSLGAGPEEIVGCRCDVKYRVDFLSNIGG